ncbi:MAG: hypothetical protein JJE53_03780 [Candidatus Pacebacteria bacterium]|nr:hypothetical protein [Candidatus Paceibacterota bacterium]
MTTISVPIPAHMEESLNNLIESGYGSNKADVIRRSITKTIEDEAVLAVLRASKEPTLSGDLKDLMKKLK